MSDVAFTALMGSIPPTLMGLAAVVVAWRTSAKADTITTKADTIIHKAEEIHTLTNSNLTAVQAKLVAVEEAFKIALERIATLEAHIARGMPPPFPTT